MYNELIVARMDPESADAVAGLFADFDKTEMPGLMGTRRRQLFYYQGLYFHLQEFDNADGGDRIEAAKTLPRFIQISQDLRPYISAFDPETWKTPKDAMATRFYNWPAE
jgi:cyclase